MRLIAKDIRILRAKFNCILLKLYKVFQITRVCFLGHSVELRLSAAALRCSLLISSCQHVFTDAAAAVHVLN